jgi:uncharacterized protein
MEQRVSLITLGVYDLARAKAFYERLGWTAGVANDNVVFFQAGGMIVALWSRDALAEDSGRAATPVPAGAFGGIALAYNVRTREEVDATLAEAVAAGATITTPAHEAFWGGYTGYFADPDGHAWEVAWNPGWRIAEDGSVRLT